MSACYSCDRLEDAHGSWFDNEYWCFVCVCEVLGGSKEAWWLNEEDTDSDEEE